MAIIDEELIRGLLSQSSQSAAPPPVKPEIQEAYLSSLLPPKKPRGFFQTLKSIDPSTWINIASGITALTGGDPYLAQSLAQRGAQMAQQEATTRQKEEQMRQQRLADYMQQTMRTSKQDLKQGRLQQLLSLFPEGQLPEEFEVTGLTSEYLPEIGMKKPPQEIFQLTEEGKVEKAGEIPARAKIYKEARQLENKLEEARRKAQIQTTAAIEKEAGIRERKLAGAEPIIKFVEEQLKNIPSAPGIPGRLKGYGTLLSGMMQTDPEAAAYMSMIEGLKVQVARSLGDVGNLSVIEQEAAKNLLPSITDNQETREQKLKAFKEYVRTKLNRDEDIEESISFENMDRLGIL